MKRDFDPEDIHELGVAFENCCAAIPDTKSQQFREQLALKLINWASFGEVDGTKLYVRALETIARYSAGFLARRQADRSPSTAQKSRR
jgi:hypothetical protein